MATFLFDEHVFGPIQSRRLGASLGINLLSTKQKVCNFNCIYCECGLTNQLEKEGHVFVDKEELLDQLQCKLVDSVKNEIAIDSITFAGNGEPTMHKQFLSIVKAICKLRDTYFPNAIIAVLSNGYTLGQDRVRKGLAFADKAIIKMDAGNSELIELIDQPKGNFPIEKLIKNINQFNGNLIIQTMFLRGTVDGKQFDNTSESSLSSWFERIELLAPKEVMIYSLDRDTPLNTLEKIPKIELDAIAEKIQEMNIETTVV